MFMEFSLACLLLETSYGDVPRLEDLKKIGLPVAGSCNSQRDFSGVSALPVHEGLTPELLVPWRGSDTSFGCVPCQMKKTISPEYFGHVKNPRSFTGLII